MCLLFLFNFYYFTLILLAQSLLKRKNIDNDSMSSENRAWKYILTTKQNQLKPYTLQKLKDRKNNTIFCVGNKPKVNDLVLNSPINSL